LEGTESGGGGGDFRVGKSAAKPVVTVVAVNMSARESRYFINDPFSANQSLLLGYEGGALQRRCNNSLLSSAYHHVVGSRLVSGGGSVGRAVVMERAATYSSDSYWLLAFFIFRFRRKRLIVSLAILAIWEHLESFPP
jgi:hypothetical protein